VKTVWSLANDSWSNFAFSYKWFYIGISLKSWWYSVMDSSARDFFAKCQQTDTLDTLGNLGNCCVRSGSMCKKRWWCVEIFNNKRNKISSKYITTKTDPSKLDEWHRHSNCSTTIDPCNVVLYPVHHQL
jgi:hypothetical protein